MPSACVCVGGNAWLTVCCVVQASLDHTGGIVWVGRMVFVQRLGGCLGWTRLPCVWWIFKLTCASCEGWFAFPARAAG